MFFYFKSSLSFISMQSNSSYCWIIIHAYKHGIQIGTTKICLFQSKCDDLACLSVLSPIAVEKLSDNL